ncbi:hypothetical protein K438DRAFT_1870779 [Mycena galopus ATCC 62051]|nr:hypothetical protein K438DRAFT_1870779 [Mycena galopus ATCC 62051]
MWPLNLFAAPFWITVDDPPAETNLFVDHWNEKRIIQCGGLIRRVPQFSPMSVG